MTRRRSRRMGIRRARLDAAWRLDLYRVEAATGTILRITRD
jgi:hypothetical protein